jgi:L-2-amino-thiazoline-4-carboxylic acid hydrolase
MTTTTPAHPGLATRWKVRRFQRLLNHNTDSLTELFGATETTAMRQEMLAEYQALLPQVPDIGGRRNPLTPALAMSAWAVAIYRVVLRHGGDAQDAGDVLHQYLQTMVGRIPQPLRFQVLGHHRARVEKMARRSQQRRYPDDWVGQVIDGTGQAFDFGIDWTECGVEKFLRAQGADEFTPYICALDYVTAQVAGEQLTRTKTLSWGCDRCDFRFTHPGTTTATWPPDFPERTCGQPQPEVPQPQ